MSSALRLSGVKRTYIQGTRTIHVLRGIELTLQPGEILGLLGPSGSGKSTLLHIAGLLERPDEGEVRIGDRACSKLADSERTLIRRDALGFIYQFHHLLQEFTALENVTLPMRIAGLDTGKAGGKAAKLLSAMNLKERIDHLPSEMSGGEQQRVAIARALANDPDIILADEPTGNLDEATADVVMDQLVMAVKSHKAAAIVATHNLALAARMDRVVYLHDGHLSTKKP